MIVTGKMVYDELQRMKEEDIRNSIKNSNRMKETLTKESKAALINAFRNWESTDFRGLFSLGRAISIVESFPISDGGNQSADASWIPVTERLPEKYQLVLIFNDRYGTGGFKIASFDHMDYYGKPIFSDRTTMRKATHWKPLPSAPNKRSE